LFPGAAFYLLGEQSFNVFSALAIGLPSSSAGSITVDWTIASGKDGLQLHLLWAENGGPPVKAPDRRGFGSRMIEKGLSAEPRGSVSLEFEPSGLRCRIVAPLPGKAE